MTADNLSPALSDDEWDRVVDTNLSGAFRLTRRALRPMLRARYGRIVNVASVVGLRANPGQANYAAAKAGLVGLTKTVAAEVAKRGVTVNAVAPGFIATEMTGRARRRQRAAVRRPGPARRHPRGGRRLRAVPGLRGRRVRHRHHPDRRRRPVRLKGAPKDPMTTVTREAVQTRVFEALESSSAPRPTRSSSRPPSRSSTSTPSTWSSSARSSRTSTASRSRARTCRSSRRSATPST